MADGLALARIYSSNGRMNRTIAYLTLEIRGDFYIYDHLTVEPLQQLGWRVVEIPWDRPGIDWSEFDAVVIRSTWDYQDSPEHFLQVLAEIENSDTPLFNPLRVCQWNLNKSYLRDLESQGVPIVPTQWLQSLDKAALSNAFEFFGAQQIVAKPMVSANADDTFVLELTEQESWQPALEIFKAKALMLQPFIQSLTEKGEYSLFYFGNQFSHAILKKPKQGDFRVQEEFGGVIRSVVADRSLTSVAEQAIQVINEELLYARIDLVHLDNGQPAVIELELIEPSLYFQEDPKSPQRFAETLDRFVSSASLS